MLAEALAGRPCDEEGKVCAQGGVQGLSAVGAGLQSQELPMPEPHHLPCPQGYSFVAPSVLFDHNNAVMSDALGAPGGGEQPGRAAVARSAMMQVCGPVGCWWSRSGAPGTRGGKGCPAAALTAPLPPRNRPSSSSTSWTCGSPLWARAASPCAGAAACARAARSSPSRSSVGGGLDAAGASGPGGGGCKPAAGGP